jgi:hypothetical protein
MEAHDPVSKAITDYRARLEFSVALKIAALNELLNGMREKIESAIIAQAEAGGYQVFIELSPELTGFVTSEGARGLPDTTLDQAFLAWARGQPWGRLIRGAAVHKLYGRLSVRW